MHPLHGGGNSSNPVPRAGGAFGLPFPRWVHPHAVPSRLPSFVATFLCRRLTTCHDKTGGPAKCGSPGRRKEVQLFLKWFRMEPQICRFAFEGRDHREALNKQNDELNIDRRSTRLAPSSRNRQTNREDCLRGSGRGDPLQERPNPRAHWQGASPPPWDSGRQRNTLVQPLHGAGLALG
jgi:hypothetical protein